MTALAPYVFDGTEVRVFVIDGEPWFVLADLCRALGLVRSASQVAERVSSDALRQAYPISDSLGRAQQATLVSEPGMYEVVIRSDSAMAVPFRRWVTHEVLPSIRRTGSYAAPTAPAHALPQTYAEALRELATTWEAKIAAEQRALALSPRAAAWDHLASTANDWSVQQAAAILARDPSIRIGRQRLFEHMAASGWVFRTGGHWMAYASRIESGHLAHRAQSHIHPRTGEVVLDPPQVRVTVKGLTALHKHLGGSGPLSIDEPRELEAVSS